MEVLNIILTAIQGILIPVMIYFLMSKKAERAEIEQIKTDQAVMEEKLSNTISNQELLESRDLAKAAADKVSAFFGRLDETRRDMRKGFSECKDQGEDNAGKISDLKNRYFILRGAILSISERVDVTVNLDENGLTRNK